MESHIFMNAQLLFQTLTDENLTVGSVALREIEFKYQEEWDQNKTFG